MDAGDGANVTWSFQASHVHGKGLCADAQYLELTMAPAASLHLHLNAILQVPNHACMALTAPGISLPGTSAQLGIHLHRLTELSPLRLCTGEAAQPLNLLAAGLCQPHCGG